MNRASKPFMHVRCQGNRCSISQLSCMPHPELLDPAVAVTVDVFTYSDPPLTPHRQ